MSSPSIYYLPSHLPIIPCLAEMALEDTVLYRLNDMKALAWLSQKVERLKRRLQELNSEAELDTMPCTDLDGNKDERQILLTALELVCEYLPGEWGTKLASKYDCDLETLFSGGKQKNKRPASVWEAQNKETDRLLELSRGAVGKEVMAQKPVSKTRTASSSKLLKAKASAKYVTTLLPTLLVCNLSALIACLSNPQGDQEYCRHVWKGTSQ